MQRSPGSRGMFLSKVSYSKYEFLICQTHTKILLKYNSCHYSFYFPRQAHLFFTEKKLRLCSNKQKSNKQHCPSHLLRLLKKRPSLLTSRINGQKVWLVSIIIQTFDLWNIPSQSYQKTVFVRFRNKINSRWCHKYSLCCLRFLELWVCNIRYIPLIS